MSFDEEYYTHLEEYYNDMLTSKDKKYSKCEGCENNRKFIIETKDDTLQLIYTCGSTGKKCGPIFRLTLPKYINYNNDYTYLYDKINNNINYEVLSKYIKIDDKKFLENEKEYLKSFEELKILFERKNDIKEKKHLCEGYIREMNDYKKDNFKLFESIKNEENMQTKKRLKSDYIETNQKIKELNKLIKETSESINLTLTITKPKVETTGIEIKESDKTLDDKKEEPDKEESDKELDDKVLDDIMDIDKFQKRKDKFTPEEYKECNRPPPWKKLDEAKDEEEYMKILKEISTNPLYEQFNQIYFHAGDRYQYQKYGYLKTRMLKYPDKHIKDDSIFNNYNIDTTYSTFKYIFEKLKKGIYVSIRNNKLDVFLPFSNVKYINNWSEILKKSNSKLVKKIKNKSYNLPDPKRWYANNCIFTTYNLKYKYKKSIQEGDKTIVPLKYFLIGYIQYLEDNDIKIDDVDFFFNPRDFPILKHDYKEPYEQIFPDQKIEEKYQYKSYTPILSQCGNINFHDIPAPTEDDMLRITKDIYPDSCKNPYNPLPDIESEFSKKKSVCVFRGSATGCGTTIETNMRLKAAQLSYEWEKSGEFKNKDGENILDAKLTAWNKKPKIYEGEFDEINIKDFKFETGKSNFMDLKEQSKHKYILNIDGHVKAFRLGNELRMGSVILLVDSPYTLWFQNKLKEYEHYVPVKDDLSNLKDRLQWCLDNDDKCKEIANNAKKFYDKHLSREGTYNYFNNLISNLSKLRKPPVYTMNENRLSIIVAYRDPGDGTRKSQLDIFLQQMQVIFNGKTSYHIYIVEQESERDDYDSLDDLIKQPGSKMAKFNLGRLKNIGYQIAHKENSDVQNNYYILSDVDLLPSVELLPKYLEYPNTPIHLANMGTRYNKDKKDKHFLGGVISVNTEDFKKSNGYPNNFWGWGGEDNALNFRFKNNNIRIDKTNSPIIDLENLSIEKKLEDLKARKNKEQRKWEKLKEDKEDNNWKKNGLNDIKKLYKIIEEKSISENITHIKVFLNIEPEDTPKSDTPKSDTPKSDTKSDKEIKIGSKVEFTIKNGDKIQGEVIEFTKKGDKCRICCKSNGSNYMVPLSQLTLIEKSVDEETDKGTNKEEEDKGTDKDKGTNKEDEDEGTDKENEPSNKEDDLKKVKEYIQDPEHPYITLVGLFNLAKRSEDKGAKIGDLAIVDIEGPNFKKAMSYLNQNTWIIEYMDTKILIELQNKDYYGLGSSEVDRIIKLELKKRKDEIPYYELTPQLQSDSTPSVEENVSEANVSEANISETNVSEANTIGIGSNVKWTRNGKEFTGIIDKITSKTYKICCKPGKQSSDTGPGVFYMVPKDDIQLN